MQDSESNSPVISVSADCDEGICTFSVTDNGIGIPREYQRQIFGLFKRLHGGLYEGTGIGLPLRQRIFENYGGRIWVESTVGQGSTFFFTLPAG
ncbi:MAG TPA: ATP-binding protein [Bryobacteraceae bacterium]|nr:ATP-binding protein [Bryobacteraceae bacterium]